MVAELIEFLNNHDVIAAFFSAFIVLVFWILACFVYCLIKYRPKSKKVQEKELRDLLDNQPKPGVVYHPNVPPSRMIGEDDPDIVFPLSYTTSQTDEGRNGI